MLLLLLKIRCIPIHGRNKILLKKLWQLVLFCDVCTTFYHVIGYQHLKKINLKDFRQLFRGFHFQSNMKIRLTSNFWWVGFCIEILKSDTHVHARITTILHICVQGTFKWRTWWAIHLIPITICIRFIMFIRNGYI